MSIKEIPGFNLGVANSGQFQFAKLDVEEESSALYDEKRKGFIDLHGESTARIDALVQEMLLSDLHQDGAQQWSDIQSTFDRTKGELRRNEDQVEKHGTKLDAFQHTVQSQTLDSSRFLRAVKYEEEKKPCRSQKELVQFPSEKVLAACLKGHRLTRENALPGEKEIVEIVAHRLANKEVYPLGVDMAVVLTLEDVRGNSNEKLFVNPGRLMTLLTTLTAASKDCASGSVPEQKSEVKKTD